MSPETVTEHPTVTHSAANSPSREESDAGTLQGPQNRAGRFGHKKCGARWTGYRAQHCPTCCETFTGTASGDMHRTGKHAINEGPERRRCLTADEMLDKGMTRNKHGQWTTGQADPRFATEGDA